MGQIVISAPDAQLERIYEAFANEFEWDDDGTLTKEEFTKKWIVWWISEITKNNEHKRAVQAISLDDIDIA